MQPARDVPSAPPRRRFRPLRYLLSIAGGFAVLFLILLGTHRCGRSDLQKALDGYKPAVERLLDSEQAVWGRLGRLSAERLDDAAPYFAYLRGDARTFYLTFGDEVRSVQPGHPDLEALHRELVQMAERRLEFVTLEVRNEAVYAEQRTDARVQELDQVLVDAEAAQNGYRNWVQEVGAGRYFDPRFTQLDQLRVDWSKIKKQLHTDQISVGEAQTAVRVVLRKVEQMHQGKFLDENGKRLLEVVVSAERVYDLDIQCMPVLDRARRAAVPAQEAAQGADRARNRFIKQLMVRIKTAR